LPLIYFTSFFQLAVALRARSGSDRASCTAYSTS
jgi:hypothetical protein